MIEDNVVCARVFDSGFKDAFHSSPRGCLRRVRLAHTYRRLLWCFRNRQSRGSDRYSTGYLPRQRCRPGSESSPAFPLSIDWRRAVPGSCTHSTSSGGMHAPEARLNSGMGPCSGKKIHLRGWGGIRARLRKLSSFLLVLIFAPQWRLLGKNIRLKGLECTRDPLSWSFAWISPLAMKEPGSCRSWTNLAGKHVRQSPEEMWQTPITPELRSQ